MARRNVLRSWLTATLLCSSGAAGVLVSPPPTGAAPRPDCVPERTVTVYETEFKPAAIWARTGEFICFVLAPGVGTHRTVTLEADDCNTRFTSLCEQRFDDARHPMAFRFSAYDDYSYFDRYAWEERGQKIGGTMVVSASDPTVQPSPNPTTTTSSTTTTTAPVTPTSSTTTTTAPTPVRPFLVPDPAPTTTTTAVFAPLAPPATAPPPPPVNKDKPKDKAKGKPASPATPTTVGPDPSDTMPPDSVFDPAALTPWPTLLPEAPPADSGDESALKASAAASLLEPEKSDDGRGRLMLMAAAVFLLLLIAGGFAAWLNRASRYDPA